MKAIGKVMEGQQKGREHGFPTANIQNEAGLEAGIYAARVSFENEVHNAAIYVGTHKPQILEANILDWSGDLYGKEIMVEIVKKIRDDKNEPDPEKMKMMIADDIKQIRKCLQA